MESNPTDSKFKLPGMEGVTLNEFQIWILVQMGVEDARFPSYSSGHWSITPKQISRTVPQRILPQINSMEYIWSSLIQLKDHNFIDWNPHNFEMTGLLHADPLYYKNMDPHDKGTEPTWKHDNMNFHITSDGVLVFRKYMGPLSDTIKTETYERIIEKTEGPKEVKTAFKNFPDRIKNKVQERVENATIDGFIDLCKEYGPPAISFVVKLVVNSLSALGN
jgi:hypothetical protein